MKRVIALATCIIGAVTATAALAATSDYAGPVEGGGNVQLRLKGSDGGRRVTRFDFQHVGLSCNGHHHEATGNLSFTKEVENGSFVIRGSNSHHGMIRVNGKLVRGGRRVTGTIRLDGPINVNGAGKLATCHSGVRHWNARRL
jgi:hypothetical protein